MDNEPLDIDPLPEVEFKVVRRINRTMFRAEIAVYGCTRLNTMAKKFGFTSLEETLKLAAREYLDNVIATATAYNQTVTTKKD